MEVTVGMTTWSEHQSLIKQSRAVTLNEYAQFFPVVEVDTFFYALPRLTTVQQWLGQVSPRFQFIVKAHQTMTKHPQANLPAGQDLGAVFANFQQVVSPLVAAGQLKTVLFQFPPTFTATPANIDYLMQLRRWLPRLPLAVEFRHQSWYKPAVAQSLVNYCRELRLTLVAADEPHQLPASVPFLLATTTPELAMIRLHGRNVAGWNHPGAEWRKQRTLYTYSAEEIAALARQLRALTPAPKETCVIFNNNSGGAAAGNALDLVKELGLHFTGLVPREPEQLDLF